jgi:hypothetical protein
MSSPVPTPGWYPDPSGAPGMRYWDGNTWTVAAPQAPTPLAVPPRSNRKVWPWLVIGLVVLMFGGCTTMCSSIANEAGDSRAGQSTAKLGERVSDGKFSFYVMDQGKVDSGPIPTPRGEWYYVTLAVTNIANEPQSFFVQNQKLIDSQGREYAADAMAALRMNEDAMALNLGPGFSINVRVPFDIPPGTQPEYIVVHDSALSGGGRIALNN